MRRWSSSLALLLTTCLLPALADTPRLHTQVLVFIPAYEGSQLYDPTLLDKDQPPPCVWGGLDAMRMSKFYFSLRMPNVLEARPMLSAGPIDVYESFVSAMTEDQDDAPHFTPYTAGADFFTFSYDWRQEIAAVSAPALGDAFEQYARIHEQKTGIPAADTKFIIVTHSMGGLVARTLISERPELAARISMLYLVGCPNLGSVKSIKTVVIGPGGLKENALGFTGALLNLLPNNVDANVTKLTAITRPSLYELLPFDDPRWECVEADGSRHFVPAADLLTIGPWQQYWPSAEIEKRLFLDDWLKKREVEGRKHIVVADWEFCQDPQLQQLQKILVQVRDWRLKMGSLNYTSTLMTNPGESTRLRVVVGTGLKTPTGVITEGAHDSSLSRYTYAPDNDGDETVTGASALDDFHGTPDTVKLLNGVSHGQLMNDRQFLTWFWNELSNQPLVAERGTVTTATAPATAPAPVHHTTIASSRDWDNLP
jgi:predicted alpha/beta-hydrolase family hydrolase